MGNLTRACLLGALVCHLVAAAAPHARLPWEPRRLGGGSASSCDQGCSKAGSRCGCGSHTRSCAACASCCDIASDTCVCIEGGCDAKTACKREFGTHAFKPHRIPSAGKIPSQLAAAAVHELKLQASKSVPAQEVLQHTVVATLVGKKEEEVEEVAEQNVLGLFRIPVRVRAEEAGSEFYISLMTAYTPAHSMRRATHPAPTWELHLVKAFEDPRTGKAQLTVMHPKHTTPAAGDAGLRAATRFAAKHQCVSGACSPPSRVIANVQRVSYVDLTAKGSRASRQPWAQQDLTACYTLGYVMADGRGQSDGSGGGGGGGGAVAVETQFEAVVCMQEGDFDSLALVAQFSPRTPEMRLVGPRTVAVGSGFGDRQFAQLCRACSGVPQAGGSSTPKPGRSSSSSSSSSQGYARMAEPATQSRGTAGSTRYGGGSSSPSSSQQPAGANSFTWLLVLGTLLVVGMVYRSEAQGMQAASGSQGGPSYAQVQGAEPTMMPSLPAEAKSGAYGST